MQRAFQTKRSQSEWGRIYITTPGRQSSHVEGKVQLLSPEKVTGEVLSSVAEAMKGCIFFDLFGVWKGFLSD